MFSANKCHWFSAAELATFVLTRGHCLMTHVDKPMFTGKAHYMFQECKRFFNNETPGATIPLANDTVSLDMLRVSQAGEDKSGAASGPTEPVAIAELNKWLGKCDVALDPEDLADVSDGDRATLARSTAEIMDVIRRCLESGAHDKWSPEVQTLFDRDASVTFPSMTLSEYPAAFKEWAPILEKYYYMSVMPSPEEEEGPYEVFTAHLLAAEPELR